MCGGFVDGVAVNMWGCVYTYAWSVKHLRFLICILFTQLLLDTSASAR